MFCPRADPSLQTQEPRMHFCRRQVFHRKLSIQGCSFTRDCIGSVASHCSPHPTLSLASEQTLEDLKRSQGHQLGPLSFTEIHHRGYISVPLGFLTRSEIRKSQSPFVPLQDLGLFIALWVSGQRDWREKRQLESRVLTLQSGLDGLGEYWLTL